MTQHGEETGSALNNLDNLLDPSLQWSDVHWLKSITRLPIVLKGILTVEDAILAADAGVAGILVSNHGARQVDGWPASVTIPYPDQADFHQKNV